MDKLFKEYEEWCVKENKDPLKEETVREFQNYKAHKEAEKVAQSKAEKKEDLVAKQKEIFKLMAEYAGVKVKYDENEDRDFFGALDHLIREIVATVVVVKKADEVKNAMDTILN